MIINRHTTPFTVFGDDSILNALRKISENKAGIVFCVDEHGLLTGSFSDGDFRRWVTSSPSLDMTTPVTDAAHHACTSAAVDASPATITALFRPGIEVIPLLDDRGHLAAVATEGSAEMTIGRHTLGHGHPALLIAEIGNNHQGDVSLAKHLVDLAKGAGADAVKFQLRDLDALYRQSGGASAGEDLGAQYTLNLLAKFSLRPDEMIEVLDHCKDVDIDAFCTPWDLPSLRVLADYGVPALKIASADMTNHTLLRACAAEHLPMLVSTGMSTEDEILGSVEVLRRAGAQFALLQCQSTYPAPFKDVNLRYMNRLSELGNCPVGYSGHERGYHVPIAAVARGANIIEKHFTIDKTLEGNDHQVSLLPEEFAEMVQRIREVEVALGTDRARAVSTGEMMNRANLAKSLVATRTLEAGEVVTRDAVAVKSPGRGLQPNHLDQLVGRTMRRQITEGDFFYETDLTDAVAQGRHYTFRRPWGLPVRYHDARKLLTHSDTNPDFLEFHLSYKDVEMSAEQIADAFEHRRFDGMGYTVHCPDLYAGDFIINLASTDEAVWERSIVEVQKVIQIARDLDRWFDADQPPVVICTMGGFTKDAFVDPSERPAMYARIAQALERIDEDGVRLTSQTLPPYPWLMGGQQHHNLFMGLGDTVEFCRQYGRRLTFDLSHSKLAANFTKVPFSEYVAQLAPLSEHLHIVDAEGVDGEGPQIGEGEIDWPMTARQLDELAPGVTFIPEIWQGHVNNGEGFWTALERLENWF
ncbi:N-acetylneuraminate synthase family protein [Acidipropionibacterium timonense]|uniref:N-acetylneuraminate synthase family protein n=1 Tax=Acidipropionibacterium timonense TaxID=2161818 RepID=UPI0010316EF1|nr:N-acetylneuraminate synthase family protein [Acidipropionibacterium timonense]